MGRFALHTPALQLHSRHLWSTTGILKPVQLAYGDQRIEECSMLATCTELCVNVSKPWKRFAAGLHPADILLLWAAKENDTPKTAELLRAGADASVKVRVDHQPRLVTR